jgi:hypothetical protein
MGKLACPYERTSLREFRQIAAQLSFLSQVRINKSVHENVVWRGEISKRWRGSDDHTLPAILRIGHVELRAESLI